MKREDVKRNKTEIITKTGVRYTNGKIIAPTVYDFVGQINDDLFAATKGSINGLRDQVGDMQKKEAGHPYGLVFNHLLENKSLDTDVDLYTSRGKLHVGYKILAVFACPNEDMLLVLDDEYKWNMVLVDYQHQIVLGGPYVDAESIEMDYDNNRFVVSNDKVYVIVSFNSDNSIKEKTPAYPCKPVKLADHGYVFEADGKYGFIKYSGEIMFCAMYDEVEPMKNFIKAKKGDDVVLYNYSGHRINKGILY